MIKNMIENRIIKLKEIREDYKKKNNNLGVALCDARQHELEALLDEIELTDMVIAINDANLEE